jgi:lipoprotein-anchoring transpeptidase ErfK/SrfK
VLAAALSVIVVLCGVIVAATKRTQTRQAVPEAPAPVVWVPVSQDTELPPVVSAEPSPPGKPLRSEIVKAASGTVVVVDKGAYTLEVFHDGEPVKQYGIAVGKNTGNKERKGDMRTPEGEFPIVQIQDASTWTHDFRDGKGQIKGAYGPYFIRLGTPPWKGIGIHGTHAPSSIGTNVSEGCIRLKNDDIAELRRLVKLGDKVIIRK